MTEELTYDYPVITNDDELNKAKKYLEKLEIMFESVPPFIKKDLEKSIVDVKKAIQDYENK